MSTYSFNSQAFIDEMQGTKLAPYAPALAATVDEQGHALKHGHLPGWEAAVNLLPPTPACPFSIVDGAVSIHYPCEDAPGSAALWVAPGVAGVASVAGAREARGTKVVTPELASGVASSAALQKVLAGLKPWRKGPFNFGPVFIDTEWRSDWKWDRLSPHLSPLDGRTVLDVGCGSGYHMWRMRDAGASTVLGIDPSLLYVKQFEAAQHFIQDSHVQLLPLAMEALPAAMQCFDTVFSMGVLYHRRDPDQHLSELALALSDRGELVLETLVSPGDTDSSLSINDRYANMRNIYELPTVARLCRWISRAGFNSMQVVDITITSRAEQRSTPWMSSYSLAQALDPDNPSMTVEGYPRPLRAVVIAQLER